MKLPRYDKSIVKSSLNLAVPAMIESFFISFVGLADSYMVSSLGASAVASVGLTSQPKMLGFALFIALNVSVSALVARRFGEQNRKDANTIFSTSLAIVFLLVAVISTLLVVFASPIISLCGSTPETHDSAVLYYQIVMGGMIFNCLQMCINSAQRGMGNTKITMRTNLTSNTVNIIFNYFLIGGNFGFPALGIKGAAIATVLGTVVSCAMSIISILNPNRFVSLVYIFKEKIRPAFSAVKSIIQIGYGVFIEQILMRVGFMATSVMAAHQGMASMAVHQVGMNILGLSFSFGDGLQSASVALIGRSLGQKNPELAKQYGRTCQMIGTVITITLATLFFFGAEFIMSMFFKEPEIVELGISIMHVVIFIVLFQIRQIVYMGCLRGAGDTLYTAIVSTISVTFIRTVGSYVGGYILGLGIVGIWMGILADQVSRFVFSSIRFKAGKWTKIKI